MQTVHALPGSACGVSVSNKSLLYCIAVQQLKSAIIVAFGPGKHCVCQPADQSQPSQVFYSGSLTSAAGLSTQLVVTARTKVTVFFYLLQPFAMLCERARAPDQHLSAALCFDVHQQSTMLSC